MQGTNAAGGGCYTSTNANCISEEVVDASTAGDGQGSSWRLQPQDPVVLVRRGPRVCAGPVNWTPVETPAYVSFTATAHAQTGAATAGVFYARKKTGVTATNCNACLPVHGHNFAWGQSYSAPGAAG